MAKQVEEKITQYGLARIILLYGPIVSFKVLLLYNVSREV